MKKAFIALFLLSLIFICSCNENSTIGIIGGADGPTAVFVGNGENSAYKSSDKFFIDKALEHTVIMGEDAADPDIRRIYSSSEKLDAEIAAIGGTDYTVPKAVYTVRVSSEGLINHIVGLGDASREAALKLINSNRIRLMTLISAYNATFGANKLAAASVTSSQESYVMPGFEGNFGIILEYDGAYSSFTAYERAGEGVVQGTTNFIYNGEENKGVEKLFESLGETVGEENVVIEKIK